MNIKKLYIPTAISLLLIVWFYFIQPDDIQYVSDLYSALNISSGSYISSFARMITHSSESHLYSNLTGFVFIVLLKIALLSNKEITAFFVGTLVFNIVMFNVYLVNVIGFSLTVFALVGASIVYFPIIYVDYVRENKLFLTVFFYLLIMYIILFPIEQLYIDLLGASGIINSGQFVGGSSNYGRLSSESHVIGFLFGFVYMSAISLIKYIYVHHK